MAEVLDADDDFRARVAKGLLEDEPDRASWLFLVRPDGWADELALLDEGAAELRADEERRRAERRVEQLSAALERRSEELDSARSALEVLERELADERLRRHEAERESAAARERSDQLAEERARAVRELKRTEALAGERLDRLRRVEAELSEVRDAVSERAEQLAEQRPAQPDTPPDRSTPDALPIAEVAAAVAAAGQSTAALADSLGEIASLLAAAVGSHEPSPPSEGGASTVVAPESTAAASQPAAMSQRQSRPPRRVPLRTLRGVVEDSADGVEQLMASEGLVAIVDGYNVAMERWPDLDKGQQRDSLVRSLGGVAARLGAAVHVVFDGDDAARPWVGTPLPVRVHFSASDVEADDVILSMVARLPTDTPVLVVSSDRRVAQGSRRLGANTAGSHALIDLISR